MFIWVESVRSARSARVFYSDRQDLWDLDNISPMESV